MLITTTHMLQNCKVTQYFGVVNTVVILGTSFVRDFFARLRNFTGGRVHSYEREYREARRLALEQIACDAEDLGANAVIGIRFDHEVIVFERSAMVMLTCEGTAVYAETASDAVSVTSCDWPRESGEDSNVGNYAGNAPSRR